ncbi:MAG: polysaccharide deacetylase family protein [Thermoleophilaceae bacterium]|nr:polysaccharide deacetylase family protein [Thermoleophilaceae bacterium]
MWWNRELANCRPRLGASLAIAVAALSGCGGNDATAPAPPASLPTAQRSGYSGCTPPGAFLRHGSRREQKVALTFDDTPSATTLALAKVLSDHDAKATFFVFANQIGDQAGSLRRLIVDGSELGSHSYSHLNMTEPGVDVGQEVRKANSAIEAATGFTPCLFRAPYGKLDPVLVRQLVRLDMTMIGWDVDPADWEHPGAEVIASRVLKDVRPGSIVVLHDSPETQGQTIRALPAILDGLATKRLETVTVTELLGGRMLRQG